MGGYFTIQVTEFQSLLQEVNSVIDESLEEMGHENHLPLVR